MREADDGRIRDRTGVFIDTEAALAEAGDLTQPIAAGIWSAEASLGSADLCRGELPRPRDGAEITLFKSVGSASRISRPPS